MKSRDFRAASGIALLAFLIVQPAAAQDSSKPMSLGGHVDANGMPSDHSTPQERAETALLNVQMTQSNAEIAAQDNNNKAKYQIEERHYQEQLRQNQAQQQVYQKQKAAYEDRKAHYEALRARYDARFTTHRGDARPDE